MLHNTGYDFNDDLLPIGASYWARLVETELPRYGSLYFTTASSCHCVVWTVI